MRPAYLARWLALAAWPLVQPACGPSETPCTCVVENNGERRTLACGDSVCVGGTTVNCAEMNKSILRSACTAPPASSEPVTGPPLQTPPPDTDRSCDDLRTFCSTSCGSPPATSADCQATASSGDQAACASWSLASGALCRP